MQVVIILTLGFTFVAMTAGICGQNLHFDTATTGVVSTSLVSYPYLLYRPALQVVVILTLGLTFVAMIAGIFGQNLHFSSTETGVVGKAVTSMHMARFCWRYTASPFSLA